MLRRAIHIPVNMTHPCTVTEINPCQEHDERLPHGAKLQHEVLLEYPPARLYSGDEWLGRPGMNRRANVLTWLYRPDLRGQSNVCGAAFLVGPPEIEDVLMYRKTDRFLVERLHMGEWIVMNEQPIGSWLGVAILGIQEAPGALGEYLRVVKV